MIRCSPGTIAMLKLSRPHSLMIAISMPSHGEPDEDGLDRERDDNGEDGDDIATEAIVSIVRHLEVGKASAVRTLRAFTAALDDMCNAFMDRDYHAVGDAADAARDALHNLISDERG